MEEIFQRYGISSFGVMDFLQIPSLIECRAKSRLPQNPRSVICFAFPYYVGALEGRNVARYAALPDYHGYVTDTLSKICNELSSMYNYNFTCFSDISPLPEVFCAVKAGLGFRGKSNLLITKEWGSYVVLGEIVTDMPIAFSKANEESCENCGQCQKHCPNFAIGKTSINYESCVSAISQRKGELTILEKAAMQKTSLVWGCDCCQDCCPHNNKSKLTYIPEFLNSIEPRLTLENMDTLIKTRAYGYKGKALLKRNLTIANNCC